MAGLRPYQDAEKVRQRCSRLIEILNVPQRVRLRFRFAGALLDGLFEHPLGWSFVVPGLWATIVLPQLAIAEESKEGHASSQLGGGGRSLSQLCKLSLFDRPRNS